MRGRYSRFGKPKNSGYNWRAIWAVILILLLVACSYVGIYHSHRYFEFHIVKWLVIIGIFSLCFLDMILFGDKGKWMRLRFFLIIVFIGCPIAYLITILHNSLVEKQLSEYGVTTRGIVNELLVERNKNQSTHYAKFTYQMNDEIWTQKTINSELKMEVGDTLEVLCSKEDPEIFILLGK